MKRLFWSVLSAAVLTAPAFADGDRHHRGHSIHKGLAFKAVLSGAQEVPGNDSKGFGVAVVRFDAAFRRVFVNVSVHGLTGSFAAAHFHCNRAGANGPPALGLQGPGPLVFDGKGIRGALSNDDFLSTDCEPVVGRPVNNVAALALAMRDGLIYINVHSDLFPPGEIRGQLLEVDDHD